MHQSDSISLKKRLLTALLAIPLAIAAVWFDQPLPWFTVLAAVWGLLAVYEFYKLVAAARVPPLTYFGCIWTLLFIIHPHIEYDLTLPLLLSSAVVISLIWLLWRRPRETAFLSWAWTIAGILYLGWLLSHLVALRGLDDGRNWLLFALLATFASDTAAFFYGRTFGRHRLAPSISPGKTWEGSIAGVVAAAVISLLFVLPTGLQLNPEWWQLLLLGVAVSVFGQLGDLVESLFKRSMGAKDSGYLVPGHGGFLDRTDSVIFAGVALYYLVLLLGG